MNLRRLIVLASVMGYLVIVTAPLALGFLSPQASHLAHRPRADDLGSALAMVGFAAIFVEFVLLGRFRPLSTSLGSDFLMQAHQLIARTALALILVHPFLYSLWGEPHAAGDHSFAKALRISGPSLLSGAIAWVLVISIVFLAIRRERPDSNYDRWRMWHAVMAVAIVVLGLHHTLTAGRYSLLTPLAYYWWAMATIAALAIITVHVTRPMLQKRSAYAIASVTPQAKDIYELVITPTHHQQLRFKAGQFAWVKLHSLAAIHDHPFSIASSPRPSGELHFLVKSAGDFTESIAHAAIGTAAYVDGPHGHFRIPADAQAVVMIAGGIGIAPFCALLHACVAARDPRPIRLIYGNRLASQGIDIRQLTGADALADFHAISVIGEPQPQDQGSITGQLDAAVLAQIFNMPQMAGLRDRAVFMVCGPAVMIDAVERSLADLGIPLPRIISEKFQYHFDLRTPRNQRTLAGWLAVSAALFAAAIAAALL